MHYSETTRYQMADAIVRGFAGHATKNVHPDRIEVLVPDHDKPIVISESGVEYPQEMAPELKGIIDLDMRSLLASLGLHH